MAGDLGVSELAEPYPISFAAVQKHVAVLERAGLVRKRPAGRRRVATTDMDGLREARAMTRSSTLLLGGHPVVDRERAELEGGEEVVTLQMTGSLVIRSRRDMRATYGRQRSLVSHRPSLRGVTHPGAGRAKWQSGEASRGATPRGWTGPMRLP